MSKLITVHRAKEEIKRLQAYVDLVESYEADTLDKLMIKEYAFSNSMVEVVRVLERRGLTKEGKKVEKQDVVNVINGKPQDELHRIVRAGYRQRTKPSRSKSSFFNHI